MFSFLQDLVDFAMPRTCHICGNKLSEGIRFVCPLCMNELPRTLYHRQSPNPMEERFIGKFPFERATSVFFYSSESKFSILIQDMKYRHFRSLARHLGKKAGEELFPTQFFSGIDFIVPVPMHFLKRASRGYNQTEEIAKGLEESTGIPVRLILTACKPHKTQTARSHSQRGENIRGVFKSERGLDLSGKHILLLDDICTTGSTLSESAKTLLAVYPDLRISMLTLGATY